jgi:hypothetical protein
MRVFSIATLIIGAVQIVFAAPALNLRPKAGTPIPNQYIVLFKDNADPVAVDSHRFWLEQAAILGDEAPALRRADGISYPAIPKFEGFSYLKTFESGKKGYAAKITKEIAESLAVSF